MEIQHDKGGARIRLAGSQRPNERRRVRFEALSESLCRTSENYVAEKFLLGGGEGGECF